MGLALVLSRFETRRFRDFRYRFGRQNPLELLFDVQHFGIIRLGYITVPGTVAAGAAIVERAEIIGRIVF